MDDFSEINQLRQLITVSLMAAFIAVGAFVIIPVGPVPVSLQTFFVLLTGLLLSPRWAVAAVGLYLFAGIIGLPVFAGGTSGIGRIAGPTGGYLISALPAVWVASRLHHLGSDGLLKTVLSVNYRYRRDLCFGRSLAQDGHRHAVVQGVCCGDAPFFNWGCHQNCRRYSGI